MGRRPRASAVSGDMRHEALPHGGGDARTQPSIHEHEDNPNPRGGDARQPRRRGRRACGGRQARRGRRRDRVYDPTEGRSLTQRLTERRSLRPPRRAECAFPSHHRPGDAGPTPPPACGALWKMAQLGKCARATPCQAAGGLRRGPAGLGLGPGRTERRSLCFGSIRTAQSRYGSRTGSYAQFIYMMWWQSARVTQRRECRRPAADSGRGAWLRPKPRPRKRVAAAMPPWHSRRPNVAATVTVL